MWTRPELARRWFPPPEAEWLTKPRANGRVGGDLSFHVRFGPREYFLRGRYTELVPNERVALDWSWQTTAPELGNHDHSAVAVIFSEARRGTEVLIRHEGLPTTTARDTHVRGWIR